MEWKTVRHGESTACGLSRATQSDLLRHSGLRLSTYPLWHITKVNAHSSSDVQIYTQLASACQRASHIFLMVPQSPYRLNSIRTPQEWSALLIPNKKIFLPTYCIHHIFCQTHIEHTVMSSTGKKLWGHSQAGPFVLPFSPDCYPSRPLLESKWWLSF